MNTHPSTHLRLDHIAPVIPHGSYEIEHIDGTFVDYPLQLTNETDKGASSSHTSTAVDHHGPGIGGIRDSHFANKMKQGCWIDWYAMVGPAGVMVLYDNPLLLGAVLTDGECPDCVVS